MALYHNRTHRDAIVTVKIETVADPQKALKIGVKSAMNNVSGEIGVHDLVVGPGQSLELSEGVTATFLAVRTNS